jgi:hypothetical protein
LIVSAVFSHLLEKMVKKSAVDTLEAFRAVADRAGMCPAAALLEPSALSSSALSSDGALEGTAEGALEEDEVGRTDWGNWEDRVNQEDREDAVGICSGRAGHLPKRQMVECVCEGASVGGYSFFEGLMRARWESGIFSVLVDAANAFDPGSFDAELTEHLLWVRVANAQQLVRALDLLLRDDNFALVAADTRGMALKELQSIQPFVWYRLQRLAHQRAGGCVIFSETPCVRCADRRTLLSAGRVLGDLDRPRQDLLATLQGAIRYQNRGEVLRVVGS